MGKVPGCGRDILPFFFSWAFFNKTVDGAVNSLLFLLLLLCGGGGGGGRGRRLSASLCAKLLTFLNCGYCGYELDL